MFFFFCLDEVTFIRSADFAGYEFGTSNRRASNAINDKFEEW